VDQPVNGRAIITGRRAGNREARFTAGPATAFEGVAPEQALTRGQTSNRSLPGVDLDLDRLIGQIDGFLVYHQLGHVPGAVERVLDVEFGSPAAGNSQHGRPKNKDRASRSHPSRNCWSPRSVHAGDATSGDERSTVNAR